MFNCDTCGNSFKYKYTLKHHQNTAKYCLKKRGQPVLSTHVCNGCQKGFPRKCELSRHTQSCSAISCAVKFEKMIKDYKEKVIILETKLEEKNSLIEKLREENSSLQDKLLKAATKPTTINHNNQRINKQVNQLLPLTQEYIESQVPHLTIDHIRRGAQGYADFALEFALKDRIMCTDFSRRRGKYKDEDGNVIDDPEMKKVSRLFFQAIHDHNTTLTNQYGQELYNKLTDILQNAGDELTQEETDKLQLTQQRILQEISKVNTSRIDVTDIAKGKKSELLPEFVKEVCALSS